jgi:hypothetical protein
MAKNPKPRKGRARRGPKPRPVASLLISVPHTEPADRRAEARALAAEFRVTESVVWRLASDLTSARVRLHAFVRTRELAE